MLLRPLVRSVDCASSCLVSGPSLHTVDILNAPFHSYCMYYSTLDPLPIRLVVDRPLWTSSVLRSWPGSTFFPFYLTTSQRLRTVLPTQPCQCHPDSLLVYLLRSYCIYRAHFTSIVSYG